MLIYIPTIWHKYTVITENIKSPRSAKTWFTV